MECGPSFPAPAKRRPPSKLQSWKEGAGQDSTVPEAVKTAAHKEEEVIASWFCFAAGHQSPSLEMVGYKQQKKLTKKILNNEEGYCTAPAPWLLFCWSPSLHWSPCCVEHGSMCHSVHMSRATSVAQANQIIKVLRD